LSDGAVEGLDSTVVDARLGGLLRHDMLSEPMAIKPHDRSMSAGSRREGFRDGRIAAGSVFGSCMGAFGRVGVVDHEGGGGTGEVGAEQVLSR